MQSPELALRCGHGPRAQEASTRDFRRQPPLRVLLRADLSVLPERLDARQVFDRAERVGRLLSHDAERTSARLCDDLECGHRRYEGGCRHARHSADIRDPGSALHRPAEADRAGHQGAAPAARRGLVGQHIRAAGSCDLSGKAGSRLSVLRNQQCAQPLRGVASAGLGMGPDCGFPRLRGLGEVADRGCLSLAPPRRNHRCRDRPVAAGRRRRSRCGRDAVGRHAYDRTRQGVAGGCAARRRGSCRRQLDLHRRSGCGRRACGNRSNRC